MKFSSIVKIEKRKIVTSYKIDFREIIENSLNEFLPIILNGVYLLNEFFESFPKLQNTIWIEPNESQAIKTCSIIDDSFDYKIVKSVDFTKVLLNDNLLSDYQSIIINNYHQKDPYSDLFVSNVKYIQNQRKQSNLQPLKIVLLTYPLPVDFLSRIFDNSFIIDIENRFNLVQSINLIGEFDLTPDNYLEAVFHTIYVLFRGKIDGLDSASIDTSRLKVLVFLANQSDCRVAYRWLTSRLVSYINAYISLWDNNETKKSLESYSSVVVVSSCMDATSLASLGIKFDYVIDPGFVSCRRLHKTSRVDCLSVEKADITDSMIKSGFVGNPSGRLIQLFTVDKRFSMMTDKSCDLSSYLKVKEDVTDYLFCQIALGEKCLREFGGVLMYFAISLRCGLENLIKAELIVKTSGPISNEAVNQQPKVVATLSNYELTELGKKCLQLRPIDCQTASVLLHAVKDECLVSCLTLVSLLRVSEDLFIDLFNSETDHLTKLKEIYNGNDDFEFLVILYRHYVNLSKEKRVSFLKNLSLNKSSMSRASKIRTSLKEIFTFPFIAKTKSENVTESFVAAYPHQIAKYSQTEKMYMRPGQLKGCMLIDKFSFAFNEENPHPFVFYYSSYTEGNSVMMKYVSPISQDIWDRFSNL